MLKKRLVSLRKEKGLSQYDAAERLGFSRGKLANYEQGTRQPDYETLIKIADFYDVSLDYLLGKSDKKETDRDSKNDADNTEDANLFFFDIEGLTEEEIDDIKRHIDYVKWKAKQERGE
ncbi:helix-turn-helix transcriptional regulator [Gracilibacillus sp. S3-1-1]|uniref:Helix-turn-helix transcriptional regulator n=1 Tax=Gracilibacillus pellucidus TaxID=3095368 RepID=A0ACC6M6M0_9BACI|nr:helix-turn-helix transcriptional regulator [Gracilibacillus sp. S3-1-1]MDX8046630.1 helix-turn-helix transcriptional regulator [Gracilibacillus sp. S3-1-1]